MSEGLAAGSVGCEFECWTPSIRGRYPALIWRVAPDSALLSESSDGREPGSQPETGGSVIRPLLMSQTSDHGRSSVRPISLTQTSALIRVTVCGCPCHRRLILYVTGISYSRAGVT